VYYLRQAVAINPEDVSLQFSLAGALSESDNGEEAARILKRLIESRPKFGLAHFNLGNVYARQKHFREAAAEYETAYHLDPANDEALISAAKAYIRLNDFAAAHPLAEKFMRGNERSFDAWYFCGIVERALGNYTDAARLLRKAIQLNPDHSDARYNLGFTLSRMDQPREARAELERAKQLDPKTPEIRYQLASVLRELGEQELSRSELTVFRSLKQKRDAMTQAHGALDAGNELLRKGDARAAIAKYRQALAGDPENASTYYNLSLALAQVGDIAGQTKAIEKAIESNPQFALAHNQLGVLHLQHGRTGEAKRELRTALAIDPQLAEAHNNLGVLHNQMGDPGEAASCFRMAIRSDPAFAQAHLNLGLILASAGQLAEAEKEIETASALSGGSPQISAALTMIRNQRNAVTSSAP
jgi:tetratricopeptide (TPR) repeat protein